MSQDFQLLFHESVSPKHLSIPLGPFQIFSKIHGDICSSRCITGVVDTGGKWKKSSIIKVLIILFGHLWEAELTYRYIFASGLSSLILFPLFATGVIDTGGKFAADVIDTGGKLPPVSLTPAANFAAGFVDTGGKHWWQTCHQYQQH